MIIAQIRGFDNDEDDVVSISLEKRYWIKAIRDAAKKIDLQDSLLIESCPTSCEDFSGKNAPYILLQICGPITEKHEKFYQAILDAGVIRLLTSTIDQNRIF